MSGITPSSSIPAAPARFYPTPKRARPVPHTGSASAAALGPASTRQRPHPCGHDPAAGLRRRSAAHAPARRARPVGRAYTGSTSAQSGPANGGTSLPAPIGLGIAVNNRNDYSDERNRRSFDGCLCSPRFSGLLVMNRFSKIARGSNEFHERRPCRLDGGNPPMHYSPMHYRSRRSKPIFAWRNGSARRGKRRTRSEWALRKHGVTGERTTTATCRTRFAAGIRSVPPSPTGSLHSDPGSSRTSTFAAWSRSTDCSTDTRRRRARRWESSKSTDGSRPETPPRRVRGQWTVSRISAVWCPVIRLLRRLPRCTS